MSQTRTPSLVAQPMFFEGIWKVGVLSAGADVETVGSGSSVTVTVCRLRLGCPRDGHGLGGRAAARSRGEHQPKEKNETTHAAAA